MPSMNHDPRELVRIAPTLVSSSYRRPARDCCGHSSSCCIHAPLTALPSSRCAARSLCVAFLACTVLPPLFADSRPSPSRVHVRPRIHLGPRILTTRIRRGDHAPGAGLSTCVLYAPLRRATTRTLAVLNAYTLPLVVCARFFLVCVHAPRTRTHAHALVACICTNSPCSVLACTYTRSACQRCDRSLHVHVCMCVCVCMYDSDYDYDGRVCVRLVRGANPSVCAIAISFAEQSVFTS